MKKPSWTYRGNRYIVDWGVLLIILAEVFIVKLAGILESPANIVVVIVSIVIVLVLCFKLCITKIRDSEKISFNLTINIQCYKKTFEGTQLSSVMDEIEEYGLAIYRARKFLQGDWKVTEKGRLIRGSAQDIENRIAVLDIDDVTPGLAMLEKVLAGKAQFKKRSCSPHLHFETGGVIYVLADEDGLYID